MLAIILIHSRTIANKTFFNIAVLKMDTFMLHLSRLDISRLEHTILVYQPLAFLKAIPKKF